ncbi:hypothetical protein NAI63_13750, partial [Francisella tularensis subsp. holarctica]|nr:hypothetical protein [Francisella tularensis subsp. holarctica]
KTDTYNLYLAYHEGLGGDKRGTHRHNSCLKNYARKTTEIAQKYTIQLQNCEVPRKTLL